MRTSVLAEIDSRHSIADALNVLLARTLTLQLRTKGCHWHVTGPQFAALHLLFDEQAEDLAAMADVIAERCRALGAPTIGSVADVVTLDPLALESAPSFEAVSMLNELRQSNRRLATQVKDLRKMADDAGDVVVVSLTDGWLAEVDRRIWMLSSSMPEGRA